MKKCILSILAFLLFSIGTFSQCFTPVLNRLSFQSMDIYISLATLYGNNLQVGDEVGVFDGDKCVGVGVLTEELTGAPVYLEIEVPRQFLWWDGFTPGDTILYSFCSEGEVANPTITPTYISNGPTFTSNGSCVVELRAINTAPVITSVPVTEALPGTAYSYTVTAVDIDGDDLSYTALVLPGWLVFNAATQTLAATPGEGDVGDQYVTIRISDGSLYVDHTFVITVDSGNHAPAFTSDPLTSAVVGEAYEYTMTAYDIDSDTLSYSAPQIPDWLTFFAETHVLSGVPQSADQGRHDIIVRVSDGKVSAEQSYPIYVENANSPPTFTSTPVTSVSAGDYYVYTAEALDADGDDLSYSALTLPGWLSFDSETQNLHGTPTNADASDHNVTLRVSDGEAAENQNFVITVQFVNGMEELSYEEGIKIYPNPTDGSFFVELSRGLDTEISLEILDPLGRILQQDVFPPYFRIVEEYNMNFRPAGIYLIRIYDDSFQFERKLMIQ